MFVDNESPPAPHLSPWRPTAHLEKVPSLLDRVEVRKVSNSGKKSFQAWKAKFPALEIIFSTLGNFIFQGWNDFWKTAVTLRYRDK